MLIAYHTAIQAVQAAALMDAALLVKSVASISQLFTSRKED